MVSDSVNDNNLGAGELANK